MKQVQITKPVLNTAQALTFATGQPKTENVGKGKGRPKKMAKNALNAVSKERVFFAPEGDKRLTINISSELHKKLKLAAVEGNSTAGEMIEQLIKQYVK
jgi:hypothetical protein